MTDRRKTVLDAIKHKGGGAVPMCIRLTEEAFDAYGERLLKDYGSARISEALESGLISRTDAVSIATGSFLADCPFPWWNWDYARMPGEYSDPFAVPSAMPPVLEYDGEAQEAFEKTRFLKEEFGLYTVAHIWGSHWEKAFFARGIENLLADIAGEPDFSREFFGFIIEKNMKYLENILACPYYDGILLGSDWGTQRDLIMSPASWKNLIKPGEKKEYDAVHAAGKHVFIHSCGCILKIMDEIKELGADVLNPVQPECMDLAFLKEKYGGAMTFWGGISTQRILPFGTPDEVKKEARRVIELMSADGGYITASSQEIQTDVPYENLRALTDTARDFAGLEYR